MLNNWVKFFLRNKTVDTLTKASKNLSNIFLAWVHEFLQITVEGSDDELVSMDQS